MRSISGRIGLALVAALAFGGGCGDDDEDNPFREFQIQDELEGDLYIYRFAMARSELRYLPEIDQVLGIHRSDDGLVTVGYFGPPLNAKTFAIAGAAVDSNGNNDFFDEEEIPLTSDSSGTFSETGDELDLVFEATLNGLPVSFTGEGELTEIVELP